MQSVATIVIIFTSDIFCSLLGKIYRLIIKRNNHNINCVLRNIAVGIGTDTVLRVRFKFRSDGVHP